MKLDPWQRYPPPIQKKCFIGLRFRPSLSILALSGRRGRYGHAYGICTPLYCNSLKKNMEGGVITLQGVWFQGTLPRFYLDLCSFKFLFLYKISLNVTTYKKEGKCKMFDTFLQHSIRKIHCMLKSQLCSEKGRKIERFIFDWPLGTLSTPSL